LLAEDDPELKALQLHEEEWTYVHYFAVLLRPFFYWTELLSKTSGVTINLPLVAYNNLFSHIVPVLQRKIDRWKRNLATFLISARAQLLA
jgi:hypothetical protein